MQTAAIINALAALVVVAYSVLRVHVLQWSTSPLAMASHIIISVGSLTMAFAPVLGLPLPMFGGSLLHVGLAVNCVAHWERTRCDDAGKCRVRFVL